MKNSEILKCARDYINSSDTVEQIADKYGVSKKTLQNNFKKLKDIDEEIYNSVEEKKQVNQVVGRKKGGSISGRFVSYTEEEANMIADAIINQQLTYKEAEEKFGKAHSTIYDMVHSDFISDEKKSKLDLIAIANNKGQTIIDEEEIIKSNGSK
ncbi:MAG: sporulation transcriptional regulator SpoIIID [Bacilli bacterium]|nr:sporulation transcriptional regulator SpoIIID [Bacilli bacterium]